MSYLCTSFGVRTCCKADMYINRRVGCLAFIAQDIKRESGGSPEQSRCCKFTRQCTRVTLWQKVTVGGQLRWEGATEQTSQKTCQQRMSIRLSRKKHKTMSNAKCIMHNAQLSLPLMRV